MTKQNRRSLDQLQQVLSRVNGKCLSAGKIRAERHSPTTDAVLVER